MERVDYRVVENEPKTLKVKSGREIIQYPSCKYSIHIAGEKVMDISDSSENPKNTALIVTELLNKNRRYFDFQKEKYN